VEFNLIVGLARQSAAGEGQAGGLRVASEGVSGVLARAGKLCHRSTYAGVLLGEVRNRSWGRWRGAGELYHAYVIG